MTGLLQRAGAALRVLSRLHLLSSLIGLALIAVLLAVSHPADIWESIQETAAWTLLAALALNVPIILLRVVRTDLILRHMGYALPLRTLVPVQLAGQTSSTLTPAASGDYLRAYMWRASNNVPLRAGAAVVTFERLYSLGLMITLAVLLITLPRHGFVGWVGVAIGLAAATVAPLIFEQIPPRIERWALAKITRGPLSRFAEGAFEVVDNFRLLMRSLRLLAQTSTITLVIYALSGAQVWLILAGLDHRVPITQAVAAYAASQAVGILSTLPFGLGTTDAVVVALLAGYGVTIALAASVAVLLRAVVTLPQALAGMVAYARFDKRGMIDRPADAVLVPRSK